MSDTTLGIRNTKATKDKFLFFYNQKWIYYYANMKLKHIHRTCQSRGYEDVFIFMYFVEFAKLIYFEFN